MAVGEFYAPAGDERRPFDRPGPLLPPHGPALPPSFDFAPPYDVAIKCVRQNFKSAHRAAFLLRELALLRSLRGHRLFAQLYHVFQSPPGADDVFLVFERAASDLSSARKEGAVLTMGDVKRVMLSLVCAVGTLHSSGWAHRDIKPANILCFGPLRWDGVGEPPRVALADFGSARPHGGAVAGGGGGEAAEDVEAIEGLAEEREEEGDDDAAEPAQPMSTTVVTRTYRAPEFQLLGYRAPHVMSCLDVWSLGCVFWDLLTMMVPPAAGAGLRRGLFESARGAGTPGAGFLNPATSLLTVQLRALGPQPEAVRAALPADALRTLDAALADATAGGEALLEGDGGRMSMEFFQENLAKHIPLQAAATTGGGGGGGGGDGFPFDDDEGGGAGAQATPPAAAPVAPAAHDGDLHAAFDLLRNMLALLPSGAGAAPARFSAAECLAHRFFEGEPLPRCHADAVADARPPLHSVLRDLPAIPATHGRSAADWRDAVSAEISLWNTESTWWNNL